MPALFLIVFVDLVGFGIIIPLLPFYAEHHQATPDVVGLVMATYSLTQFVAAPYWGRLSDRMGRRPVLMLTLVGTALAYFWLGYADSLWELFAARALGGFMAGNISTAFAYAADVTTPENRAKGMGMIGAAFGLGFIAGPAIGGMLAGSDPLNADYHTPAMAACALSALAFVLTAVMLKESLSEELRGKAARKARTGRVAQFRDALSRPGIGFSILLIFLSTFVFAGMETTFAMWSWRLFGWGPAQNGYLFAGVGLVGAIIQGGMMGRLARRHGEARLVTVGAATLAAGLASLPLAGSVPAVAIAMTVTAIGFSIMNPALTSLVSLQAGAEDQGTVMGVSRSSSTLARVAGPAWAGAMFAYLGPDWPYYGGALVMAVVVALCFWRRWKLSPD
jgi:DHA1 family tetracycline resistance protein-like MFS transporter